jgi:hypothetical protein
MYLQDGIRPAVIWFHIFLVFHPGGMNSWFWYEFMVCSMGSILANIADNLLKIDYGM